jgi:hypothetical protein
MRNPDLRSVTVYFGKRELDRLKTQARREELTLSAHIRACLDLPVRPRGAPRGNRNRQHLPARPRASRKQKRA